MGQFINFNLTTGHAVQLVNINVYSKVTFREFSIGGNLKAVTFMEIKIMPLG